MSRLGKIKKAEDIRGGGEIVQGFEGLKKVSGHCWNLGAVMRCEVGVIKSKSGQLGLCNLKVTVIPPPSPHIHLSFGRKIPTGI